MTAQSTRICQFLRKSGKKRKTATMPCSQWSNSAVSEVEELLTSHGLKVDWQSRPKIEKVFGAAIQRASLDLAKLAKGEFARPPSSQPAMSVTQHRPDTIGANEPVTFETLITGWASERRPMQKTIYEYKRALGNLAAFLGHDDASRLSSQESGGLEGKNDRGGLTTEDDSECEARPRSRHPAMGCRQQPPPSQPRSAGHPWSEDAGG